jgi:signal transduction histidine kinase
MTEAPYRLPRARAERTIAATRIAIASFSLYAVWLDPAQPERFTRITYLLHIGCIGYAIVLAGVMWRRPSTGWLPIVTHVIDIVVFSLAQYFTLGPSSPFFNYFIFSLFCGAVRWGWRGTLATAPAVGIAYLAIAVSMRFTLGPTEFDLNRFIIRSGNLVVFSVLLVYLGRHEAHLRDDIRRLAGWPATVGDDAQAEIVRVMQYAASIVAARQVVAIWEPDQEPRVQLAVWRPEGVRLSRHASRDFEPWVSEQLTDTSFVYVRRADSPDSVTAAGGRTLAVPSGRAIHPRLASHLESWILASAPFKTERLSGRVFFGALDDATTVEILPLVEVVAREIGGSIDQCEMHGRARQLAIGEERIRVARDLHDGVLQSLTGVRLELQSLAGHLDGGSLVETRERLIAMERALATEQRELRFFIEGLQPIRAETRPDGTLGSRLEELTKQLAARWKTPVTLRLTTPTAPLSAEIEQALPRMIHEAVVNALKHGQPSRVSVMLHGDGDDLRVVIADDGHGFPLEGRFDHDTLMRQNLGPVSLCERVRSLGGAVSVDSSASGSRVEIRLPVAAHA